jgi:tetratricopeptide (TPR) repeat protein
MENFPFHKTDAAPQAGSAVCETLKFSFQGKCKSSWNSTPFAPFSVLSMFHEIIDHVQSEKRGTAGNNDENEEREVKNKSNKNQRNSVSPHHSTKILPGIPVGLTDLPSHFFDEASLLPVCITTLKSLRLDEMLTIITRNSTGKVGTGKGTFLSILLRKQEVQSSFQGGIFLLSPGDITSEIEYIGLLRKLIDDIVNYSLKISMITKIQSQKWLHLIRPSHGDIRLDHCLQCLREITDISNNSSSSHKNVQVRRILLVLNDLRSDYLPRLLRGCGVIFLMTTRYPDLFSDGQLNGTLFELEGCSSTQKLKIIESYRNEQSSIFSSPSTNLSPAEQLLQELYHSCLTWGEVDLLSRYIQPHGLDLTFLRQLLDRRKGDLVPGSPSIRWITDHMNDNWKSISLIQHLGSLSTLAMLYETLSPSTKLRYLAFSLLPTGVVFPLQFIMMIWGMKIQLESLELLDTLVQKGLVSSTTVEGIRLYSLNSLQSHLLILLILREKQVDPDDCSIFSSFLMCSMLTSASSNTSPGSVAQLSPTLQSYLYNVLSILIKYLTDKKKFSSLPAYRLSKYLVYWRRLYLCFYSGMLPSFHGALHYFHEVIENSSVQRDGILLFDYIYAATYLIEHLNNFESENQLKSWILKGIDVLNYLDGLSSNHLQTSFVHQSSSHSISSVNSSMTTASTSTSLLNPSGIQDRHHYKAAELRNRLGVLYRKEGFHREALGHHIFSLNTFQSSRHPSGAPYYNEIAKTFLLISEVYISEGAIEDAINVIRGVIEFQQGIPSSTVAISDSLTLAGLWISLGELYCNHRGEYQEAVNCFHNAIGIYHKSVGIHHPEAMLAEGLLGIVFLKWAKAQGQPQNGSGATVISPLTTSPQQHPPQLQRDGDGSLASVSDSSREEETSSSLSSSVPVIRSKREEGIELTSNAIAWYLRRGYTMASAQLKKLISTLPLEERMLFQNIEGARELEATFATSRGVRTGSPRNSNQTSGAAGMFVGFSL